LRRAARRAAGTRRFNTSDDSEGGRGGPRGPPPPRFPWQFAIRAVAVVTGLTLLLIVDVRGVVFYLAWTLIVLALLGEGAATLIHWRRARGSG
jgi:hypothetical protein